MAFWQLALVASALVLLGLNVGAVFNSSVRGNEVEQVRYTRQHEAVQKIVSRLKCSI